MQGDSEFARHWPVIAACFAGLTVSASPAYLSSFGLFLKSFTEHYGWSRGEISFGLAMAGLTVALCTPFVGWLADRYGARRVILAGCIAFPVCLMGYGVFPLTLPVFFALAVVTGMACSIVGPVAYLYLPPQYFTRHLGLAVGITVLGLGFGQMLMPLLIGQLLGRFGLSGAWLWLGLIVAVVGVLNAAIFIRDNPDHSRARQSGNADALPGHSFAAAIRTLLFWQLTLAFLLIILVTSGLMLHLPAILADRGYSPATAALAIALIGFGSIVGRVVTGLMLDRWPPAIPCILFLGSQIMGCLLIRMGGGGHIELVAAFLLGAALGAEGDMMPVMLRRSFGMRAFGRIYGFCFAFFQLGGLLGVLSMGAMFDLLQSYDRILLIFAIVGAVALLLMLMASPQVPRNQAPALAA